MSFGQLRRIILSRLFLLGVLSSGFAGPTRAEPPTTGPETEKRFPPLVIPSGFKGTLFACDPLVEYPSVIALGSRQGTVFVAHDYVTGLGIEIVRRDEIRLLEDTDGDGYADKSTVFAGEFNSIQGLAYHAGTVYAMHAPLLTALRDTNGDGAADERRDLLTGLGLTPEKNQTRLHCANGVAVGHDGWLYLAMGDNGVDVPRPEGDRLVLNAGGILRCRRDGRDLHVFSDGLRNIYDVAHDDKMNIFVRDNENDGGDYMIRVCHSFYGADHGYPYLYYERPDEALAPLADLGRGSSAGSVCYLETAFPPEFRGNLFCCEWGRAVVRYELKAAGSGFAPTKEIDFAAGAATDPYGFKPTDVIVDRDGSLLISDWGDGQRPKRGRGRIYRISHTGNELPKPPRAVGTTAGVSPEQLDRPGYFERVEAQTAIERSGRAGLDAVRLALKEKKLGVTGRGHAVWILAVVGGRETVGELFEIAAADAEPSVRAQAVRAIADLADPVFTEKKLAVGRGDSATASRLARLADGADPVVLREIVIALGRLRWMAPPEWWRENLKNPDAALAHAAMQTFRRCEDWPAVLKFLDEPADAPLRKIALRAVANRVSTIVVDGLMDRLQKADDPKHRQQYAETLARIYKKPGPWVYWGYRPAPRPANPVEWERTEAIAEALNRVLADPDRDVRVAVLQRMQREQVPTQLESLIRWMSEERDVKRVDVLLDALTKLPVAEARGLLTRVTRDGQFALENRLKSLAILTGSFGEADAGQLLDLAGGVEDGPVLAKVLGELSRHPKIDSREMLLHKVKSTDANVRAAAVSSLSALQVVDARKTVPALLKDPSVEVRRAAAAAAGRLAVKESVGELLVLARGDDPATRSACLDSLRLLREPSVIPAAVAALDHPVTQLAALEYLAEFGGPDQVEAIAAVAASHRSVPILTSTVRALAAWGAKSRPDSPQQKELQTAIAKVHGESGVVLQWRAAGPVAPGNEVQIREMIASPTQLIASNAEPSWHPLTASGEDSCVEFSSKDGKEAEAVWLAFSDVLVTETTRAQFLASSSGTLQVWLNGRSVFERGKAGAFQADSDRFEAELTKGLNRLVVQVTGTREVAQFHLRFRRLGSSAEHERIAQYALQNTGSADRGRELFQNVEKSLCLKCHRMQDQGGQIGPDLTGVGSRYSRIHLIESILEPSRTIAPSYETITLALTSGRVFTGVKVSENETTLTLGDDQGKIHEIPKSEVDERNKQLRSTMPDGLEKRFSDREFLDLVTFLTAQKKKEN